VAVINGFFSSSFVEGDLAYLQGRQIMLVLMAELNTNNARQCKAIANRSLNSSRRTYSSNTLVYGNEKYTHRGI
jgi:hypothetical protein